MVANMLDKNYHAVTDHFFTSLELAIDLFRRGAFN